MVEILRAGGDVHGDACTRIFGLHPGDPGWDEHRDIAKRTVFGSLFAIGPATFQASVYQDTGVRMERSEVAAILDGFRTAYPEFGQQYEYWMRYVEQNGYVPLVDGSWSWFQDGRDWPRTGWNRRVQGSLAVFVRDWLPRVDRISGGGLVLTVHDSVTVDLPQDEADGIVAQIQSETSRTWEGMFGIPGGCTAKTW
jgi:DNA polymerase I-like protein with 3'-5' exonuclease and polymerase domains